MQDEINVLRPLPKQEEFLGLNATHNLLVSGYGFGKTETKLMSLLLDMSMYGKFNPTFALYDPTYDLLDLNTLPRLLERFEQLGIDYKHNSQKKTIQTPLGKVILRSMDTPSRIVAYECFRSYIDEIETLRPKQTDDVWKKILGRNRQKLKGCEQAKNRTYTFTTPDAGFGFTYKKWGKATDKQAYQYINASTRDNPHLPEDYVKDLERDYPENMAKAFIDGVWTNILSGVVYSEFDRHKCHAKAEVRPDEDVLIGQDFNVGGCVSILGVERSGVLYIIGEMVSDTTFNIYDNYSSVRKNRAVVYPDASGANSSSNATKTDIQILRDNFIVEATKSNPRVRERVLSINVALKAGKLKIDSEACPRLTEALEQQAYTDAGEPEKVTGAATIDDFNDALGYLNFAINPIEKRIISTGIGSAL